MARMLQFSKWKLAKIIGGGGGSATGVRYTNIIKMQVQLSSRCCSSGSTGVKMAVHLALLKF